MRIAGETFTIKQLADALGKDRRTVGQLLSGSDAESNPLALLLKPKARPINRYGPVGRRLTFDGRTMSLRGWAKELGFKNAVTLGRRLRAGLPLKQVLTPKQKTKTPGT